MTPTKEQYNQEINQCDLQIKQLVAQRNLAKSRLDTIMTEQLVAEDVAYLTNMYEYLEKHHVYFGHLQIKKLHHVVDAYNIGSYNYPLTITGIDVNAVMHRFGGFEQQIDDSNICISAIPEPTNEQERMLYPHIVSYLRPALPIKLELYTNTFDEGYGGYWLRPMLEEPKQSQWPIHISMKGQVSGVIRVLYARN